MRTHGESVWHQKELGWHTRSQNKSPRVRPSDAFWRSLAYGIFRDASMKAYRSWLVNLISMMFFCFFLDFFVDEYWIAFLGNFICRWIDGYAHGRVKGWMDGWNDPLLKMTTHEKTLGFETPEKQTRFWPQTDFARNNTPSNSEFVKEKVVRIIL